MSNKKELFHATSFTNEKSTMGTASPGREFLKKLLGKTVRVVLEDKLILIGILSCTDGDQNLILSDCATFLNEGEEPISRGDVMVPGEKISKISIPIPLNMQKVEKTKAENKKKEEQLPEEKGTDKMESQEQEDQEKAAEKTHLKED